MNATDYFQSHEKYFWVWEEGAEVLAILGGSTIAYTEELTKILSKIAENGLPPFGSILLTVIAVNKTDDDALDFVYTLFSKLKLSESQKDTYLKKAFNFLKLLNSMPLEYRVGQRKQILLQTIFENAHNRINVATSRGIVDFLKQRKGRNRISKLAVIDEKIIVKNLRVLELLDGRFKNITSIIDAMGNLPEIEEALIPSLDTSSISDVNYIDFVEELMANSQTFQVGALVKPIWAGFRVPIFNAHPSQQPLGGISDLSNKGDFDKLLVAEFANDDLIFMSRLANNEVLYLHREMPPVTDKLQRVILIDISLKTWGIPKILAHATSLAISKHPKSKTKNQVFLVGNDFVLIDYENIGTIIDGLQKVSVGLSASNGIASFLNENKQNKQIEIFYITTSDGLKYPKISKILADSHALFKYIITTDTEGNIQFYRNKSNAFKHLQTITLPLEKLWKTHVKLVKKKNATTDKRIGEQLPILLPLPRKRSRIIPIGREIYFVTNRCLYRRVSLNEINKSKGSELILENVPSNGKYEIGKTAQGQIFFLSFNLQNREIVITDLMNSKSAKATFSEWKSNHFSQFIFLSEQFAFLVSNPVVFTFTPNFETNIIEIKKETYSSGVFNRDYPERQKEIDDSATSLPTNSFNILMNLKEVSVSQDCLLTFNSHRLQRNSSYFLFDSSHKEQHTSKVKADYNATKDVFLFSDGSQIRVDKKGYFELRSSDENIPTIYIPSTIGNAVGIATNMHFAGWDFFLRIPYITYNLHLSGFEKINAVKILKNYSGFSLTDAKQIIDNAPIVFSFYCKVKDAEKMVVELRNVGCELEFFSNSNEQTIVSTQEFYDDFIQKFVNRILAL